MTDFEANHQFSNFRRKQELNQVYEKNVISNYHVPFALRAIFVVLGTFFVKLRLFRDPISSKGPYLGTLQFFTIERGKSVMGSKKLTFP